MAQRFFLLFFLLSSSLVFSQDLSGTNYQKKYNSKGKSAVGSESLSIQNNKFDPIRTKDSIVGDSISIDMYKIYTVDRDSTYVDTTLTVQKEYKMNFLRKDYFELLPFSNTGHAFNKTGYDFTEKPLLSGLGANSKHYGYVEASEALYYQVPTPITELFSDFISTIR